MPLSGKDNFLNLARRYATWFALLCLVGMFAGFLFNRVVLSISMIAFGVSSIFYWNQIRQKDITFFLLGILWLGVMLLSLFWTEDISSGLVLLQVKLPLLILPLAFALLPTFTLRQKEIFSIALAMLSLIAVCYPLYFFIQQPQFYIEGYGRSQVLPTWSQGDHIRFSMAMALVANWLYYFQKKASTKALKIFFVATVILLILFLHLLAARAGLLVVYVALLGWILYSLFHAKPTVMLFAIVGLLLSSYLLINYVPTIKNKWGYTLYTLQQFQQGNRGNNYSDVGRYLSIKAAIETTTAHPIIGVGIGDVLAYCTAYYQQVDSNEKVRSLLPHNQFLMVSTGTGILGLLSFLLWWAYPIRKFNLRRAGVHHLIVFISLSLMLMVEPFLETQLGVFVYLFFLLWAIKELEEANGKAQTTLA